MKYNFNLTGSLIQRACTGEDYYTAECLHKHFCPQLTSYFVKTGIILILLFIFMSWFNWWFFNKGYKKFKYDKDSPIGQRIGDLNILQTRVYWDGVIRHYLQLAFLCFTAMVVYLNI